MSPERSHFRSRRRRTCLADFRESLYHGACGRNLIVRSISGACSSRVFESVLLYTSTRTSRSVFEDKEDKEDRTSLRKLVSFILQIRRDLICLVLGTLVQITITSGWNTLFKKVCLLVIFIHISCEISKLSWKIFLTFLGKSHPGSENDRIYSDHHGISHRR